MTLYGEDQTAPEGILKRRARELARPLDRRQDPGSVLHILEFASAGERFAIEVRWVREVEHVVSFAPVPGTPHFILGVVNLRGRILSLVDLGALLRLRAQPTSERGYAIRVSSGGMEFCIGADKVKGVRSLTIDEMRDPPALLADLSPRTIQGVTEDGLQLVDGNVLLTHQDLTSPIRKGEPPGP